MTQDELDDYFWARLSKAKLVCFLEDEEQDGIVMEWGIAIADEDGDEKILFQQVGTEPHGEDEEVEFLDRILEAIPHRTVN